MRESNVITMAKPPKKNGVDGAPPGGALIFPDVHGNRILGTLANLRALLSHHKISVRYNVISKRCEISIPGMAFTQDNHEPASFAEIISLIHQYRMVPHNAADYLLNIADANQYNPVMTWIYSKPWDGRDRIDDLCATIQAHNEDAKNALIRRWLITACSMALHDGVDAAGVLVLQGAQGIGKTWWTRKLAPESELPGVVRTGANLNPKDRDSLSQYIRYWIAELGEIGSTFRKSDIDVLKAFITDKHDILRRPYGRGDQIYPRRTAMIASVNEQMYLHDATGNRRFWTIACKSVNSFHDIDMQQLWAQVAVEVDNGESWQPTAAEKMHINAVNAEHMQVSPIKEMILEKYEWNPVLNTGSGWKTATAIARELDIKNISQRETREITNVLRELCAQERICKGYRQFKMSPRLDTG